MDAPTNRDVTQLLAAFTAGNEGALDQLLPLVYRELRRQAARYLRRERPNHTLQPTALVNEAFLRLVGQRNVHWQNRAHFFGIAAEAMRRILVDHARRQGRAKRGGPAANVTLDEAVVGVEVVPSIFSPLTKRFSGLPASTNVNRASWSCGILAG